MKLLPVQQLAVFYAPTEVRRTQVGRLAQRRGEVLFEYHRDFLASGLELSPFRLPLAPGVVVGDPARFEGLKGVFDDSLPDGWGRLLIDRLARKSGFSAAALGPLDRLALVGARGVGALKYEPEAPLAAAPSAIDLARVAQDAQAVLAQTRVRDLDALVALGSSPQGARPKALVWLNDRGEVRPHTARPTAGFTGWLVKFRGLGDDAHAGTLEQAFCLMARAAGIEVPPTRLLRAGRQPGFFAIQRFDLHGEGRLHVHTLGGLLEAPHGSFAVDYRELLSATRALTRDEGAVAEMFRRACFNVLAHNRDDHARNFAFLMDDRGAWRPSPAYDLTYSSGPGGEHSMLVLGEGRAPTVDHLLRLARGAGLKRPAVLIEPVRAAVAKFHRFADEARVPRRVAARVASALGAARRRPARRQE